MQSYGVVGFGNNELEEEVKKKYGDNPEHLSYAEQIGVIAGDFSREQQPVGKNFRGSGDVRARIKAKREYRRKCNDYLTAKAKEKIKPVGFIGGFLFMTVISAIISFFVQRLMKKWFEEQDEKEE